MKSHRLPSLLASMVIAAGLPLACARAEITGRAVVVDGDSLEIGKDRVRLFGIDAPEGKQDCRRNGAAWRCGEDAAAKLRSLVSGATLRCTPRDTDEYGRSVSVCRNGSTDINAEMVRAGLALAYRRYSNDYVDQENEARSAKRGLWSGEFTPPAEFRRESREQTTQRPADPAAGGASAPRAAAGHRPGCDIKGNINGKGVRIYHMPGSASYDDTKIDESAGEHWFCTEKEAVDAGWRAAGTRPPR
jgi:endonuclease YncB( thermonuclease family)